MSAKTLITKLSKKPTLRDQVDVERTRENKRQRRLVKLGVLLCVVQGYLWYRGLSGQPIFPSLPSIDPIYLMSGLFFGAMIVLMLGGSMIAGRSPHMMFRPEQINITMDDVKGLAPVKEDVRRSLDLFRNADTFRKNMGGTPRRGLLFEGGPGTGKTHMAKAMAAEAGVPFLFVSATSFQSMYYGATARKIRAYFKALRKAARAEGGAIGFIEEIDAIAMARGGLSMTPAPSTLASTPNMCCGGLTGLPTVGGVVAPSGGTTHGAIANHSMHSEGVGGVVNELLIQMQSFDQPTGWEKLQGMFIDWFNLFLPAKYHRSRPSTEPVNVLLVAATNRADNLDPALLRPGRFDRRLTFESPDKNGRRELIDFFLEHKSHENELDSSEHRDALAGVTQGYTPVMIEHLMDEGLVNAIRRGGEGLNWKDLEHARLVVEVGLGQPVAYTDHEKRLIATHEAGHATLAYLVAPERRLEILTIIKRAGALGLLAHGDQEDVYTRSSKELRSLITIAFGGQVAEELFFEDVSTGPGGDLHYATGVAAQMVGAAGMCDTLISYNAIEANPFNSAGLVGRVLGDHDGRNMVETILREQKEHATRLMRANMHLVEALRDALLERHELIGREITDVLLAAGPVVFDNPCD